MPREEWLEVRRTFSPLFNGNGIATVAQAVQPGHYRCTFSPLFNGNGIATVVSFNGIFIPDPFSPLFNGNGIATKRTML